MISRAVGAHKAGRMFETPDLRPSSSASFLTSQTFTHNFYTFVKTEILVLKKQIQSKLKFDFKSNKMKVDFYYYAVAKADLSTGQARTKICQEWAE